MKKSIILEGPNGSGKSTLGRTLSVLLDMEYAHAGPSPGGTSAAFKACITQYNQLLDGVILDRCTPISRQVYEKYGFGETSWLQEWAWQMNEEAIIVLCTGTGEFTQKPYYPEGHFEFIVDSQEEIRNKYADVIECVDYVPYNWETDDISIILERFRQ